MINDPPLGYVIATITGFATYFVLHSAFGIDYAIALFLGFVGAHGGLLLSRRFLK
jgi:hypothetical protein